MASLPSVLIVDDDPQIRRVLQRLLEVSFSVDTVSNITDARARVESGEYATVLSDIDMPDGSGIELIEWLVVAKPHIRAILMSGSGPPPLPLAAKIPFLPKPLDHDLVLSTVSRVLNP